MTQQVVAFVIQEIWCRLRGVWTSALYSLALALAMAAPPVTAATVYRCVEADGSRVFADRPCGSFGLRDARGHGSADPSLDAPAEEFSIETESGPVAASGGCPGPTPEALRDSMLAALRARDLNSLTGMYHWAGAGRISASAVIAQLQGLIAAAPSHAELRSAENADDWLWAGLPPPSSEPPPDLLLFRDELSLEPLARFRLREQAGCVWLANR